MDTPMHACMHPDFCQIFCMSVCSPLICLYVQESILLRELKSRVVADDVAESPLADGAHLLQGEGVPGQVGVAQVREEETVPFLQKLKLLGNDLVEGDTDQATGKRGLGKATCTSIRGKSRMKL